MELINETTELVDLISWNPEPVAEQLLSSGQMDVDEDFGSVSGQSAESSDFDLKQGEECGGSTAKQRNVGRQHYDNGTLQERKDYFESLLAPSSYHPQYHLQLSKLLFFFSICFALTKMRSFWNH
jgi:hypothetical protein